MSKLNLPVPEGGTEGNMVILGDDGHSLIDGPPTGIGTGATPITAMKCTDNAETLPSGVDGKWYKIGTDVNGKGIFVAGYLSD